MTPPLLGELCAGIGTGIKSAATAERGRRGRQVETTKWRHTFAACASEGAPYDGVGVGFPFSLAFMGLFVFIEPSLNFPRACSVLCLYFEFFRIHWKDQNNNNNPKKHRKKLSLLGVSGWCWIIEGELVSGSQTYDAKMQFVAQRQCLKILIFNVSEYNIIWDANVISFYM